MLIIRSWPCPKCTFIILYTTLNLKACKIKNASGVSAESKKVRNVSKEGRGGVSQKNLHDVSRGKNRYVTLPLDQNTFRPVNKLGSITTLVA